MSATTIQWTDATWNPVRGCSIVSPGCTNCYAMKQAHRFSSPGMPYAGLTQPSRGGPVWTGKVRTVPELLDAPLRWKKPRRIFVNSMSDVFHESLSNHDIGAVFGVMMHAPRHTFQVLTKRPQRMLDWFRWVNEKEAGGHEANCAPFVIGHNVCDALEFNSPLYRVRLGDLKWPLPNVWLGVSVEDQERADERIPLLLQTPAAVRFVSAEPLLGPVEIGRWLAIDWQCSYCRQFFSGRHKQHCSNCGKEGGWTGSHAFNGRHYPPGPISPSQRGSGLDWIIVGGESGPGARTFDVAWARSIIGQCNAASVPVFVKQLGSKPNCADHRTRPAGEVSYWTTLLRDRAGGDPSEWPEDLRVREFPR